MKYTKKAILSFLFIFLTFGVYTFFYSQDDMKIIKTEELIMQQDLNLIEIHIRGLNYALQNQDIQLLGLFNTTLIQNIPNDQEIRDSIYLELKQTYNYFFRNEWDTEKSEKIIMKINSSSQSIINYFNDHHKSSHFTKNYLDLIKNEIISINELTKENN